MPSREKNVKKRASKDTTRTPVLASTALKRIHGSVARELGVAIVTGVYKPGDTLSAEIEFAEKLNVSRTAYREAVRILAAKGLVESRPKAGTRINERSRWNLLDPDVLAWMFEGEPSLAFVRDLFELRMMVEPAAAELAAVRRTGADLAKMGHALEEMARHGLSTEEGREADQQFHHAVLAATRNSTVVTLSSTIAAAVSWTTIFKQRKRGLPRDPVEEHRALYEAIGNSDPAAARAAMIHLINLAQQDTEVAM